MNETERKIVEHGIRWARNILVELQGNYNAGMSKEAASLLRSATSALGKLDYIVPLVDEAEGE